MHQKSAHHAQSPFHEAQPKAQALAGRLAQHHAELEQSSSSGIGEFQAVRSPSPGKEPSSESKAPVVPPLDLDPDLLKQAYHPMSKKAGNGMEFSKPIALENIDDDDDDDGEVDEGFDDGEGTGRGYRMAIHGEQFHSQMRW